MGRRRADRSTGAASRAAAPVGPVPDASASARDLPAPSSGRRDDGPRRIGSGHSAHRAVGYVHAFRSDGGLARIGYAGELSINRLRAIAQGGSDDFLRFDALAMPSVSVDWRLGAPASSVVEIGDVAFVDFYARLVLDERGRLNLADMIGRIRMPRRRLPIATALQCASARSESPAAP